jgi:hypothetical protein
VLHCISRGVSCYLLGVNLIVIHGNLMTAHRHTGLLMSQFAELISWKVMWLFPNKPATDTQVNTNRLCLCGGTNRCHDRPLTGMCGICFAVDREVLEKYHVLSSFWLETFIQWPLLYLFSFLARVSNVIQVRNKYQTSLKWSFVIINKNN